MQIFSSSALFLFIVLYIYWDFKICFDSYLYTIVFIFCIFVHLSLAYVISCLAWTIFVKQNYCQWILFSKGCNKFLLPKCSTDCLFPLSSFLSVFLSIGENVLMCFSLVQLHYGQECLLVPNVYVEKINFVLHAHTSLFWFLILI